MKKVLLVTSSALLCSCSGFSPRIQPIYHGVTVAGEVLEQQRHETDSSFALAAKAVKKNKSLKNRVASSASSSGFGRISMKAKPPKEKSVVDDFATFPALNKQISDTLIPAPLELVSIAGELPSEVYDRLDQIYGFPNFNYQASAEIKESSDILFSESKSSQGSAPSEPKALDDFSYLFGASTSDEICGTNHLIPVCTTSSHISTEGCKIDAISELPPFSKFRLLHLDPLVVAVDDFFTDEECDRYIEMSMNPKNNKRDGPYETRSMTVGKDAEAKSQRTSTTWFHHYKNVPELMAKASRLVGLGGIDHWEEPQTVRYRKSEKFTWHLDALSPAESSPGLGGQRVATLLVYLTDLTSKEGGATIFRDLSGANGTLKVQPKKGSALVFFPAAGGIPNAPLDIRTLHCGEVVDETCGIDKWISQLWLREGQYSPSAPVGNSHASAASAIINYCKTKR